MRKRVKNNQNYIEQEEQATSTGHPLHLHLAAHPADQHGACHSITRKHLTSDALHHLTLHAQMVLRLDPPSTHTNAASRA